jgi:hypothetical protein
METTDARARVPDSWIFMVAVSALTTRCRSSTIRQITRQLDNGFMQPNEARRQKRPRQRSCKNTAVAAHLPAGWEMSKEANK